MDDIRLNVELLRQRVPNLTVAAASVGLRPATVSNLCTGKIPLARAEVKTLVALAKLAECSVDELIIRANEAEMIETGIRVIDLFAPLTRGGKIGFVARPGMGQLVLLAEIFHRMNLKGYQTVFIKPEEESLGLIDVINETNIVCPSTSDAIGKIIQHPDKRNIFLAADRKTVITGEIYTLIEKLQEYQITPTTLLVDLRGDAVDDDEPYGPLDTLWQFDAELISRGMYPAINPIYSTSVLLEGAFVDKAHLQIQQQAKKLLRRYRELKFLPIEKMPEMDRDIYQRGLRLEAFLTQPFLITESFTNRRGIYLPINQTLADVQRILKGELDNKTVGSLLYTEHLEGNGIEK
jgi:F-type H+/Na+-transporting ATPase subunit beta